MRSFVLSAVFLYAAVSYAMAQPGASYTVTQDNKNVGTAQYTIMPVAGGDTVHSSGSMHADKFAYSFQNAQTQDSQGNLVRDLLSGSVQGAKASGTNIQFDAASDSTGRNLEIRINADGKQSTNKVDRHRNMIVMPDLDAGAYALMAKLALKQPQSAWVLIPKQTGILVPADYETLADLNGTLNGQNITVKHAAVAMSAQNSLVVELFYTATGDLLEADSNSQGIRVTENGFKLLNRPKAVAPPPGQVPSQNGQGGAQGAQQGQQPAGQMPEQVPQQPQQ